MAGLLRIIFWCNSKAIVWEPGLIGPSKLRPLQWERPTWPDLELAYGPLFKISTKFGSLKNLLYHKPQPPRTSDRSRTGKNHWQQLNFLQPEKNKKTKALNGLFKHFKRSSDWSCALVTHLNNHRNTVEDIRSSVVANKILIIKFYSKVYRLIYRRITR